MAKIFVRFVAAFFVFFVPFVAAFFVFFVAGVGAQPLAVERVAWMQGCWRATVGQNTVDEQWMSPNGGTMLGMSRTVRSGATTEYELIVLKEQDGRLAYQAHPSGQPSAVFVSHAMADDSIVFENAQHDFPQRIGYRRDGGNALLAWVEGTNNGKARRVEFAYRRVTCEGS